MRNSLPLRLIALGLALSLTGVCIPFLMMMRVIESSFVLGFLSYAASVGGLLLGIIGASQHVGRGRRW
jgi:hypothetical protein